MSNNRLTGSSGHRSSFAVSYETRRIILAQGIEAHDEDVLTYSKDTPFNYLKKKFGSEFTISGDQGEYTSDIQRVHFIITLVKSKTDFKNALETGGIHVIYAGHSRYGRGACFDTYSGTATNHGDQWEQGSSSANGLFRLGYPYVPVEIEDIEHHRYGFVPVPVENVSPPNESRHPHARRPLARKTLPSTLRSLVISGFESATHQYWGLTRGGKVNLLLQAGWTGTRSDPYDLGATNLKCKVFCHFGCSSRLHFWDIVRRLDYKGWQRTTPPTDKFAYFTTAPSDYRITPFWLYYLLKYPYRNNFESWWNSLEHAKQKIKIKLNSQRAGYKVY